MHVSLAQSVGSNTKAQRVLLQASKLYVRTISSAECAQTHHTLSVGNGSAAQHAPTSKHAHGSFALPQQCRMPCTHHQLLVLAPQRSAHSLQSTHTAAALYHSSAECHASITSLQCWQQHHSAAGTLITARIWLLLTVTAVQNIAQARQSLVLATIAQHSACLFQNTHTAAAPCHSSAERCASINSLDHWRQHHSAACPHSKAHIRHLRTVTAVHDAAQAAHRPFSVGNGSAAQRALIPKHAYDSCAWLSSADGHASITSSYCWQHHGSTACTEGHICGNCTPLLHFSTLCEHALRSARSCDTGGTQRASFV